MIVAIASLQSSRFSPPGVTGHDQFSCPLRYGVEGTAVAKMDRSCTPVSLAGTFVASYPARCLLRVLPLTALATYAGTLWLCWTTFVSEGPHGGVQEMMFGLVQVNFTEQYGVSQPASCSAFPMQRPC